MRSRKGYHNDYQPNNSNQNAGRRVQEGVHSVYNNTNHGYQHRVQAAPLEFQTFPLLDEQEFLAYSQKLMYFNYPTAPTWKENRKSRDHDVNRNQYRNHSQSRRRNREEKIREEDHTSNSSSGVTTILQKTSSESQENEYRELNCQQSYPCGLDQNRMASSSESCVAYSYPNSNGTSLPPFSQVQTVTCSYPIQTFPAPSGSATISPELPVINQPSSEETQMMTYLGWPHRNEQPPTESEFTRYYREEQEQIVEMLRQIDYRHELQLDHGRASGDQQHIPLEARGVEWLRKLSTVYGDDYHRYHFRLLTSAPKERFIITLGCSSVHRSPAAKKRSSFIRRLRAKRKDKRLLPLKRRPLHDTTNSDVTVDSSNDANFLCATSPDSNNVKRISERSFYSDSNGRQKMKRFCDETAVGGRLNTESKSIETVLSQSKVKEGDSLFGMEIDGDENKDFSGSFYEIIDDADEDVANGNENVNSESKENNDGEILAECILELRNESENADALVQIERTEGRVDHVLNTLRSENLSLENGIIDCKNVNHKTMTSANEMDSEKSSDPRNDHLCHLGLQEADVIDGDCERKRLETSAPLLIDDPEMEKTPVLHEAALSNIKCLKDGTESKEDEQNMMIYREKEEKREFEIDLDTKTSKENDIIPVQEERKTLGKNKKGRKKKKRSKVGVQGKNQKVTDVVMEEKNNKQVIEVGKKDAEKQDKMSNQTEIQDKCKGEKGNGGSSTKQMTSSEVRECVELVETKKGSNASSVSKIADVRNTLISRNDQEQGNRKESKAAPARMGKVEQNCLLENDSAKEEAIENEEGISVNLKKRSKSKENDILNGNDEKKVKRWDRIEIVDTEQKSTNAVEEKNKLNTKIVVGKKVEKSVDMKSDGEKVKDKMNEVENQRVKVEIRTDEMTLLNYYGHRRTKEGVEMQKTVTAKCDKVMKTVLVGRNGKEREMEKDKVLFGKHDKEREIEKEKVSAEKTNKEKEMKNEKLIVRKSDNDSEMEMKKVSVGKNDKESEKEKVLFGKSDKEMEKGKGLIGRKGKKREIEKEKNLVGRSDELKEGEKEKLLVGRSDKKKETEKEKVLVEKSHKKREIEKEKSLVGRSEKEKEMEKEKVLVGKNDKREIEREKVLVVRSDKEKVTEMCSVEKSDKEREMEKGKDLVGRSEKEREFKKDKISDERTDRDKEIEMEKVLVGRNDQEREMWKSNCFGEMGKRKEESDFDTCYSSLPIIHGTAKRDDIFYFLEDEKSKVKFGDKRQIQQLLGEQRKSEEIQKKSKAEFDEDSAILSDEHWMSNKDTEEVNRNQTSLNEDSRSKMNNITECKNKGIQNRISSDDSLTFSHLEKYRKDGDKDKVMSIGWDLRKKEGKSNESTPIVRDDTIKKMFPKQSMQMLRKEELDDDFATFNAYEKINTLIFVNGGAKRDAEMSSSEETKRKDLKMEDNKEHYGREVNTYSKQITSEKAKTDIKMDIDDSEERKIEIKLLQKPERNRVCAGYNNLLTHEDNAVNSAHCGNTMDGNWAKMSLSGDLFDEEMRGEKTKEENYSTDDKKIKTIRAEDIEEGSSNLNKKRSEVRKDNGRKKEVCGVIDIKVKCNGSLEKEDEMVITISEERDRGDDQKQNKTNAIGRNIADTFSVVQISKNALLAKKDIDTVSNDMIEVSEVLLHSKHRMIDLPVQRNVIMNGEKELPLNGFKIHNNRDNKTNGRKSEKEYVFDKKASEGRIKRKKENNECEIKSKDTEDVSSKKREKPFPSNGQHDQQSFRENIQSGREVALYNVREKYPKQKVGKQELTKFSCRVPCSLQDSLFDKCCNANGSLSVQTITDETMLKCHRIDKNVLLSECAFANGDSGFRKAEGVIANGESNFRRAENTITNDEGGFRKAKSAISNEESRFGKEESTIANDDTSRFRKAQHRIASDESSFRRAESAIANNQSGFCKAESIIPNDESDFGKEESTIANDENIFRKSEGIIANDQSGFRKIEPCSVKNVEEEIIQMDERIIGQKKRTFKRSRKEEMIQSSECGLQTEQRDLLSIPKIAGTCRNIKEFDNGNDRIGRIGMLTGSANTESSVGLDDSKTASFVEKNKEETKDASLMKERNATEIYDDRSRMFDRFQCSKSVNGTMSSLKSKRECLEEKDAYAKNTSLLADGEIVKDEEIGETCDDRIRKFDPSGWCVSRKKTKTATASINSKNICLEKEKEIKAKDAYFLEEGEIVEDEEIIDDRNERFRRLDFSVSRGGTLSSTDSKNKCLEKKRKDKTKSRFLKNGDRVKDREDETCRGRIRKFDTLECPVIQKGAVSSVDAKNVHLEEWKGLETSEASLLEKGKVFGEEIEEGKITEEGEIIETCETLKRNTSREKSLILNISDYKTIKPEISIHLATRKTQEHSEPFHVKLDHKNVEITKHFKERRSISSIKTDSSTGLQKQRIGALNPLKAMHCSEVSESFWNRGRESHVAEGDYLTAAAVIEKAAIHDRELNHLPSVGKDERSPNAGAKTETGELFHVKNKAELQVALMPETKTDVSKPIELLDPYKNKMCDDPSSIQTGYTSKHRNQITPQMNFLGIKIEDDARLLAYSRMKTVEDKGDIKEKVFLGNVSSKSSRKQNENALREHEIFTDRLNEDDEGKIIYGEGKDNSEKVLSSRTDEGDGYICEFDLSFSKSTEEANEIVDAIDFEDFIDQTYDSSCGNDWTKEKNINKEIHQSLVDLITRIDNGWRVMDTNIMDSLQREEEDSVTEFRKDSKQLPSRELNMVHRNSERVMKKKEIRKNILDISREVNKSTLVDTLHMDTQEMITLQKDADLCEDSDVDVARSDKSEHLMSMEILSRDIHVEEKSLLLGNDSRNDVKEATYKDLKKVIAISPDQGKQQNSNQINFDGDVGKALTGVIVLIEEFEEKFRRDNQRSDLIRNSHRENEYDVHSVLLNQIPAIILTESVQQLVSANINERMALTRVLTQSPVCRYQKSKRMEISVRSLEESPFLSLSKVISDLISSYGRMVVRYLPINENKWLSRHVNRIDLDLAQRTETRLSEFINKSVNHYKRNIFLVEKDYENNILVKGYSSLSDATHHIPNMIVKIDEISILNISRATWWMVHIMKQSTDHNLQCISGTPKWFENRFMMLNDFLQKSGLPITCLNMLITENNEENLDLIGNEITEFIGKISHEIYEENAMKFHHSYQSLKGDDRRGCQNVDLSSTTPSPSHDFYEFSGEVSIKSLCVLNKNLRDIFMGQSVTVYDCYGQEQNILRSYSVVRDFEKDDENAEFVDQGTFQKHNIKMDLKDQSVNHSNIGYEFQSAISAEMKFAEQVLSDVLTKGISLLSDISGEGSKMIQGNGLHSMKAISTTARKFNEQILCDEYNCRCESEVSENASQADCLLMAVIDKGTISKEERYLGKSNLKSSFFQGEFGMNYSQASQLSVERDLSEYQEVDKTSDYSNDETHSQWKESSNRNLFRKQIFNTAFVKGIDALQKNSVIDFNLKLPVKKMDQHIESFDCCQATKENRKYVGNVLMEKFSVTKIDEAIKRLEAQDVHADVQCLISEVEDGVMKKQSIHYGQDLTSPYTDDSFLIDSVNEVIEEINPKRRNETETNDKKLYRCASLRNELPPSKASHESSVKSLDAHRVLEESTKSVERTLEEMQKAVEKLLGSTFEKDFVPSVIFESRFDSLHISPAERAEIDDISERIIHCLNDDPLLDDDVDDTVKVLNPSVNSHITLEMTSVVFWQILDDVCREEISAIFSDINVRAEQVIEDVCKYEFIHDNKFEEQVIDDVCKEEFIHDNKIEEQVTDDVCKKETLTSISDIKSSGKKETNINLRDISSKHKEDEKVSCCSLDFCTVSSGTEFKVKVCVNDSIIALEDFTKDSNLIRLTAAKLVKRILDEVFKDELSASHSHRKKHVKDITDGLSELSVNEDKSVEIVDDLLICNEAEKTTKQIIEYVCEEEFLTNPKKGLEEVKLSGMHCLIEPCSAKLTSQEGEEKLQNMTHDGKREDENFCEEMFSKLVSSEMSEINTVNSSRESFPSAIGSNAEEMFLEQMAKEGFIEKFSCGYGKSEEKSNAVLDLSISKASVKLVKRMLEDVCNDLSEADGYISEASSDYWQGMSLATGSSKMSNITEQRLNSFDGEAFSKSYCTEAVYEKNRKITPGYASDFRLSSIDAQMIPHHVMEHSRQQETAIFDDYEDENFKTSYSHFKLRETCKTFVSKILDDVLEEAFPSLRNEFQYSRGKDRFDKISSTFKERENVNQYYEENVSKIPFDNMLQEKGLPNSFVVLHGLCLKCNTGKRFKENVIKDDNEETHDNVQRILDISISKAAKSLVEKVLDDVLTTESPISQEDSLSYYGDVKRNHYSVVPRQIFKSKQANQKLKLMKGKRMLEATNDVMMPKCDMKTVSRQSFDPHQAYVTTEESTEEIFSEINENKLLVALGQDLPVISGVLLDCREGSNPAANVSKPVLDHVGTEEFQVSQKEYFNVGETIEILNPICSSLPVLKSVENMIKYSETFEAKTNYEQVSDQKCVSSTLSARSNVKAFQDVENDSSASLRSDVLRDNTTRCFTSGHVFRKDRDHIKKPCLNSDDREGNLSVRDEHENPRFTPDEASLQKCATEAVEKVLEATIEELLESTEFGTLLIPRETTVSGLNDNEVFSYGTKSTNPGIQTLPTSKQMEFDKEVMSASERKTISKNNSKAKFQTTSLTQFFFLSEIAQKFVETVLNDVLEEELQSKKDRYSPLIERDKSPDLTSYEWLSSDAALLMVEHVLKEVVREECVMLSSSLLCGRDSLLCNAECSKNSSWSEGVTHDANSKLRKRSTLVEVCL